MKKKRLKAINIAAAVIFATALILNMQTNLRSGSGFLGVPAVAQSTGTGTGTASCSATSDCYKVVWDQDKHQWVDTKYGSVSCTGHQHCESGSGYVKCDGVTSECAG